MRFINKSLDFHVCFVELRISRFASLFFFMKTDGAKEKYWHARLSSVRFERLLCAAHGQTRRQSQFTPTYSILV